MIKIDTVTNMIRNYFVGKDQKFIFEKVDIESFELPNIQETNLYIHIPFCKSMCPYCPYNRVLYQEEMIGPYITALLKEIEIYAQKLGRVTISSVYIGGGTPTNAIDELEDVIDKIKTCFNVVGDIAIETTIADINEYNVQKLKSYGINMISIGVQSFNEKYLELLGRNYTSEMIKPALELLKEANFDTVNIDLMFAFPGQSGKEIMDDLKKANEYGIEQITAYPLFTFPYSSIGEYLKINKIKMPKFFARRKFYKVIHDYFIDNGYEMTSVWSFKKNNIQSKRYSSVTRDDYIGFGAGAGSRFKSQFHFNTFTIAEYEKRLFEDKLPIAVNMPISEKLSRYYWLYWRLYDTRFSIEEFNKYSDWKMRTLMKIFTILGFCKKNEDNYYLNERGSFWIHLAQNYFVLNYINKVWSVMKEEPFPERIRI